ncbi:MAG: CPBP family intramembrane metalloprotease, partial [Oscillospiraceae bacterium]|nr:CPBP family intramembrane metalloprotease [Oscillospiraceae bacterium]
MLKDRWSYTSKHDKKQFFYTVFIISSIVLLQFILLGITADIISSITAGYFSLFFSSLEEQEFYSLANNVISILNLWGSFSISSALLILFLRRTKNKNESNAGSSISFKFKMPENMLMLLFLGLSIVYLFATLSIFFDFFIGMFGAEKTPYEPVAFPKTAVGIIVYFLALVVSPALVEEFFCRYLILNALRKYGDGFAMIVSAVFFGLMHGRTTAFFFATAIGFFLAYFA